MIRRSILFLCLMLGFAVARAQQIQNSSTEVKDYREVDGKIIINVLVDGQPADFVLDLAGGNAILPDAAERLGLPVREKRHPIREFLFKEIPVTSEQRTVKHISFGNFAYRDDFPLLVLDDEPYLRQLGVAGVLNGKLFAEVCLTIDSRRKKLTMTVPYKPLYMRLDYCDKMRFVPFGCGLYPAVTLNGERRNLLLDTWTDEDLLFTPADFARLDGETIQAETTAGYAGKKIAVPGKRLASGTFVREDLGGLLAVENPTVKTSMLGGGLLKRGLLTVDMQHARVYFQPFDLELVVDAVKQDAVTVEDGKVNPVGRDYFLEHVCDCAPGKEPVFKGDCPVVVDFWATWCGPCMKLMPEMEKLAAKYKGRVTFLKVNADKEKELCNLFGVDLLPTLLFFSPEGEMIRDVGADIEKYENIIKEKLLKE